MDCPDCGGTGIDCCEECGQEIDCGTCEGTGEVEGEDEDGEEE